MIRLKIIEKLPPFLRNKYVLTVTVFFIWLLLFDSNNLIARFKDMRELHKLRIDREYYMNKIETDRTKLNELKTDNHNLEKFAREQFKMKKADEDLYIILTPQEDRQQRRRIN
ncbi:MAG TPA: septum formation inhibitor [Bacteroidales bacterium]|nr:septum formation inhibitor [Bacteroidales bacterium]